MRNGILQTVRMAGLALVTGLGFAGATSAATVDFVVDRSGSSVTLTDTGGICIFSRCGVSASLASGLHTGDTYSFSDARSAAFDFLTFTGRGTGTDAFGIQALLKFSSPNISVGGTGVGGAVLAFGNIVAGVLNWTSVGLTSGTLPDGVDASFAFQGGAGLFGGHSVTTTASINVNSITPPAVPVPASGLMLLTAMGGVVAMRRRKAAARAA